MFLKFLCILCTTLSLCSFAFAQPEEGMTRDELITLLGEPTGRGGNAKFEMLSFKGGVIELTQGKVTSVPEDFGQRGMKLDTGGFSGFMDKVKSLFSKKEVEEDPFKDLPPPEVTVSPEAQALMDQYGAPKTNKVELVNMDGHSADVMGYLVPKKVTIIDFYAPWCGPCKEIAPGLQQLAQSNSDVYLRKINIVRFGSPIAERYQITSIPSVWVFDRQGKRVGNSEWEIEKVTPNVEKALYPNGR